MNTLLNSRVQEIMAAEMATHGNEDLAVEAGWDAIPYDEIPESDEDHDAMNREMEDFCQRLAFAVNVLEVGNFRVGAGETKIHTASWDELDGEIQTNTYCNKITALTEDQNVMCWVVRKVWDLGEETIIEYRSDRDHVGYTVFSPDKDTAMQMATAMHGKFFE